MQYAQVLFVLTVVGFFLFRLHFKVRGLSSYGKFALSLPAVGASTLLLAQASGT